MNNSPKYAKIPTSMKKSSVTIWTWDYGKINVKCIPSKETAHWVEKLLNAGLWQEIQKFPKPLIRKLLPLMKIPSSTRKFLEFIC